MSQYKDLYKDIALVKKDDHLAAQRLYDRYFSLIVGVTHILKRTFRFVPMEELSETTKAFFIQLAVEYDVTINNNFTNYMRSKLYFRVKEFMCADYEQTNLMHSDREDTVTEYCAEKMYHNIKDSSLVNDHVFDLVDYLNANLEGEELDMFLCYYVLKFTQEQMAVIFGMTQCPINIKLNKINKIIKGFLMDFKE